MKKDADKTTDRKRRKLELKTIPLVRLADIAGGRPNDYTLSKCTYC